MEKIKVVSRWLRRHGYPETRGDYLNYAIRVHQDNVPAVEALRSEHFPDLEIRAK